jgi:hypothetical protein
MNVVIRRACAVGAVVCSRVAHTFEDSAYRLAKAACVDDVLVAGGRLWDVAETGVRNDPLSLRDALTGVWEVTP